MRSVVAVNSLDLDSVRSRQQGRRGCGLHIIKYVRFVAHMQRSHWLWSAHHTHQHVTIDAVSASRCVGTALPLAGGHTSPGAVAAAP